MATLTFLANGKEFTLSYKMLMNFAQKFPEGEKYSALAEDIISLGMQSISVAIIQHSDLTTEIYDKLWPKAALCVRREMLEKQNFVLNLTDKQARDIITAHDAVMLANVAKSGHVLFGAERSQLRISKEKARELIFTAKNHPDWRTRKAVATNMLLPKEFLTDLSQQIELEIPAEFLRFDNMVMEDIPTLDCVKSNVLFYLVRSISRINNKEVRSAVINFYINNDDPGPRLVYAENAGRYGKTTPFMLEGLKMLANDIEQDISEAAKLSLKRLGGVNNA